MGKTAIVYKSVFGATRQYAEWLHESIPSVLYKSAEAMDGQLNGYDRVILLSPTYAGQIILKKYIAEMWPVLQGKRLVLVATGTAMSPKECAKSFEMIPENIRKTIQYYKIPGRINRINAGNFKRENLDPVLDYVRKN